MGEVIDKRTSYPIGYRIYFKKDSDCAKKYGFKTKIELACELVNHAVAVDCPAAAFVFDSRYLVPELTNTIQGHERDWASRCKPNRKVRIPGRHIQIKGFAKKLSGDDFHKEEFGRVRIVISHDNGELEGEPVYIITNRKDRGSKQVLKRYLFRQPIEPFYRDTKQHFRVIRRKPLRRMSQKDIGLEDCQPGNLQGIKRHGV